MFRRRPAARLEHAGKSVEVVAGVGGRILHAVPHARLGAEVHDVIRLHVRDQSAEFFGIGEIGLQEAKAFAGSELCDSGAFQGDIVVVTYVIDAEHFAALRFGEAARDVVADETGGAGHEDFHQARDTATGASRLAESAGAFRDRIVGKNKSRGLIAEKRALYLARLLPTRTLTP